MLFLIVSDLICSSCSWMCYCLRCCCRLCRSWRLVDCGAIGIVEDFVGFDGFDEEMTMSLGLLEAYSFTKFMKFVLHSPFWNYFGHTDMIGFDKSHQGPNYFNTNLFKSAFPRSLPYLNLIFVNSYYFILQPIFTQCYHWLKPFMKPQLEDISLEK